MLMALSCEGGELVAASVAEKNQYQCPACHAPVHLRRGRVRQSYFAHERLADCRTFSEGETSEHLLGKRQLSEWLQKQDNEVMLEQSLKVIHQRPDLLVNKQTAVEFQCSPIDLQRFSERVAGYREHDFHQIWLLGQPYWPKPRLSLSKVAKFIRWGGKTGAYLLFWHTQRRQLIVLHHLGEVALLPITYSQQSFDTWTSWMDWSQQQTQFQIHSVSRANLSHRQRAIASGLHHRQPNFMRWQALCYQAGTSLLTLPQWVLGDVYEMPISINSPLDWRIPLYLWWWRHQNASSRQCQFAWTRIGLPRIQWLPNLQLADERIRQRMSIQLCKGFFSSEHAKQLSDYPTNRKVW